jgi:hypothetical protein
MPGLLTMEQERTNCCSSYPRRLWRASGWSRKVETALARERQQHMIILLPVRSDHTVMTLETGEPARIHNTRNMGDLQRWKTHDVYQKAFDRWLRDLKVAARQPEGKR